MNQVEILTAAGQPMFGILHYTIAKLDETKSSPTNCGTSNCRILTKCPLAKTTFASYDDRKISCRAILKTSAEIAAFAEK